MHITGNTISRFRLRFYRNRRRTRALNSGLAIVRLHSTSIPLICSMAERLVPLQMDNLSHRHRYYRRQCLPGFPLILAQV